MKIGKYKYDYNYLLMAIPLLVTSIFVPAVFVAFLICLICGFEKEK
ncbi:hypothetical protein [Staphylococcus ureilyticus]|nr:hypothetical protein [Staphylococcus ureilyticus]